MWLWPGFVVSGLAESHCVAAEEAPTLRPPHGLLTPSFWEQRGILVVAAITLFIGIAAFLIWRARRPRPVVVVPPVAIAREALQSLQGRPEDGALALDVSQALRHYLVAALSFPSAELTTAEFAAALRDHPRIGTDLATQLTEFLRDCDVRKFAPEPPRSPSGLVAKALELISQVEVGCAPVAAPTPNSPE